MRLILKEDSTSEAILSCAFKVHSRLGPGLLENTYRACLAQELRLRRMAVATEVEVLLYYEGIYLSLGYRLDLLVEESVVVEVKSVDKIEPIHVSQLLSYLRLSRKRVGLLLNFKKVQFRDGIRRVLNGFNSVAGPDP